MKRYIKSSAVRQYPNRTTYQRGMQKYSVYYTDPNDFGDMKAQISEIHPYDDGDYAWAQIDGLKVTFRNSKGVVDTMHLWSYEPEDYEDINEYIDAIVDSVCLEMKQINKDVKPVMIHN